MELIPAFRKDQDFLDDVKRPLMPNQLKIWWLGQSGYLIAWKGRFMLVDPYLSDSLTKKYADTNKPHIRMSERVIAPENLDFIELVTSSHNHTDHLDGETLKPLFDKNPSLTMVIPEANRAFVAERTGRPADSFIGLNDDRSVDMRIHTAGSGESTIRIHGIAAAHNTLDRDENGNCKYMGYVFQLGDHVIYHSGDTLLYPGMADRLKNYNIDVALLPINGNDPSRGVAGNLNIDEAIWLGKEIRAGITIPCHYDMFTFNTADAGLFARQAEKASLPYVILKGGEGISLQQ